MTWKFVWAKMWYKIKGMTRVVKRGRGICRWQISHQSSNLICCTVLIFQLYCSIGPIFLHCKCDSMTRPIPPNFSAPHWWRMHTLPHFPNKPHCRIQIIRINETYEINANSRNIRLRIGIICKPKKQTGFTNTRVSDKKQFKEVIAAKNREGDRISLMRTKRQ